MPRTAKVQGILCLLALASACSTSAQNVTLCWGGGSWGQLGNGEAAYVLLADSYNSSMPVAVLGGHSFVSVCTGYYHSCALTALGKAWCWGRNDFGQLGSGALSNSAAPVEVAGDHTFQSISCGDWHNCGVDSEGQAWCWGRNVYGQLGTGNTENSNVPVAAAGGHKFAVLSAGGWHTCGLEGSGPGRAQCWGWNEYGQLGAGPLMATNYSYVPVEVAGGHTLQSISGGSYHSCALDGQGQAWCWGWGTSGQLGNGGEVDQRSTVPVLGSRPFTSISAGWQHTCAMESNGSMWCWGSSPQNGQGTTTLRPAEVGGGITFAATSAGGKQTCGLDTSKSVWCFGYNDDGQLGNGGYKPSTTPVKVVGSHRFILLGESMGMHTCGIAATEAGSDASSSPSTSPPAPNAPSSSSSSSVPVGAVVGGIAGAAVVVAALSFFALRPGKGWLRRRPPPATLEGGSGGLETPELLSAKEVALTAPEPQALTKSAVVGSASAQGSLGPLPLPLSYISSQGASVRDAAAAQPASGHSASLTQSSHSQPSDAVLSFVASYLGTHPHTASQPVPQLAHQSSVGTGSSGGGGGGGLQMWEVQWSELTVLRLVGHGSFGSVYLAEWNQIPVAVKVLVGKDDINRGQLELPERVLRDLQAEAAVMSRMRHPNIVQFMGLVAVPPALITEYCSRGSLYDCLATAREQPAAAAQLTWPRRLAMAVDAAAGLFYLHRRGILHRDVKSPNLLVDEHWRVKVADFNLSKLLGEARPESSLTSAAATNPIWLAPEILEGGRATAATDVYSFGMVLFEMLTWHLPWSFADMTPFKIGATVRQGGRPEVPLREALPGPDTASWAGLDAYVELMRACWAQQQEQRPSFDEVVSRLRELLAEAAGR